MPSDKLPVRLVDHDLRWPARFQHEKSALLPMLGAGVQVEHIGSTAIPGMRAKPVIDIMVLVESIRKADAHFEPLRSLDYVYLPQAEHPFPERRLFIKPDLRDRTHHLHLVEQETAFHHEHLLFRDFMRAHSDHAARYQSLKESLAERHGNDREAYSDGKTTFILEVLALALRWRASGAPVRGRR